MKSDPPVVLSVLDLASIREGGTVAESFRNTLTLAQRAEHWGYRRFWLAEHHNMTGIASAATSVLIGYVAGGTKTIRVGSGGIMLPNHAPLVIAEQFGTLETLYPGRIDLGLGRAPGCDAFTAQVLGRDPGAGDRFPALLEQLRQPHEERLPPARCRQQDCRHPFHLQRRIAHAGRALRIHAPRDARCRG